MNTAKSLGLLTTTVALTVTALAVPVKASARSCVQDNGRTVCGNRVENVICIESERNGRLICGRQTSDRDDRRYGDGRRDRYGDGGYNRTIQGFDEEFYLIIYPDVAGAVRRGEVRSGYDHYLKHGRFEGRLAQFNEGSYLTKNPDVAEAVRKGGFRSGYEHWLRHGRYENRPL